MSHPIDYAGPINHGALSHEVESYYRTLIGSRGSAFNVPTKAVATQMQNCEIHAEVKVTVGDILLVHQVVASQNSRPRRDILYAGEPIKEKIPNALLELVH